MICLAVTYIVKDGEEERAAAYLRKLTEGTQGEAGNIMYVAHRSASNPHQFFLYEQYRDQEAFDFHRRQPHFIRNAIDGIYTIIESRVVELYEPLS